MGTFYFPSPTSFEWYEGGFLKTAEQITNWFDTYGWPHEQKLKDLVGTFTILMEMLKKGIKNEELPTIH